MKKCNTRYMLYVAVTSMLAGAASLPVAFAGASPDVDAQLHATWRQTMQHTAAPAKGCYHASYPSTAWSKVDCVKAPNRLYLPRHFPEAQTVGNGDDYSAEISSGVISQTVGSFPSVSGVTSESDDGASDDYSLQLNSNFMSTDACNGGQSGCQAWEQFVYASGEGEAFMQYWLINYGDTCPSGGWMSYQGSCYMNSAAVSVPDEPITDLGNMTLTGSAVSGGTDTLTYTDGSEAYTTSGDDSVVDLGTAWQASEFNIIGDGGGSEADFNSGSSVTVNVSLSDGSSDAPTCASNSGTTGETNNLNLGSCSASGGSPSIQFTESN
jgi:hypothetical protein